METIAIDEILTTGCNVCNFILGENILSIELDKVLRAETFEEMHNILIVIFGWSSILLSEFGLTGGRWSVLTEYKPLESIDVIRLKTGRLILEGRGPGGRGWLKYDIIGFKYKIIVQHQLN